MKITLTYIKSITDKIEKVLKIKHFWIGFSTLNIIDKILYFGKHCMDPKQCKGLYSIPCSYRRTYMRATFHFETNTTKRRSPSGGCSGTHKKQIFYLFIAEVSSGGGRLKDFVEVFKSVYFT